VIVVDASIVASALADDGDDGRRARSRLSGERLAAPELIDLEVGSVWRRAVRAGRLDPRRAGQALADLAALPLARLSHAPLMGRVWALRDILTPYDAAYVALAELLGSVLLTADSRMAKTPRAGCAIELLD
jgi:predicted nucleic acid-binding protein